MARRSAILELEAELLQEAQNLVWARSSAENTRTITWCACRATARRAGRHGRLLLRGSATSKAKSTATASGWKKLEHNPGNSFPQGAAPGRGEGSVDLNRPMAEILKQLSQYPVSTRSVAESGTIIVGAISRTPS
ncbi:hypothetical protein M8494_27140 [Serratia ureilytica]